MPDIIVTSQGIENLINGFKTHKASGPDAFSATILKETSDIIAPIPQVLFQISLDTGRVSADWSKAFVTPIFEKGSYTLPSNYHPVSLTCITSKLFECIIACNNLEDNILYDLQYGF